MPHAYRRVFILFVFSAWAGVAFFWSFPDQQGTDYFPLKVGAQALIAGKSPYGEYTTRQLSSEWTTGKIASVAPVVAYPLPALLLIAPITFFPDFVQVPIWFLLGVCLPLFLFRKVAYNAASQFLPVLFFPFFHAAILKTSTLLWFGFLLLLILAMRDRRDFLIAACIGILPAKPQVGLVFASAALIVLALEHHWKTIIYSLGCIIFIWCLSLIVMPNWIPLWMNAVNEYSNLAQIYTVLPLGLLVVAGSLGLSWISIAAITQVILFPINDIYCALPILIAWLEFNPQLAIPLVALSWLAPITMANPNNLGSFWAFVLLPFLLCCLSRFLHPWIGISFLNDTESN